MTIDNITVNQFVENYRYEPDNLEYVCDIGTVKDYGISIRGKLHYNGD